MNRDQDHKTAVEAGIFYTRLCSLLGIRYPIIQGALGGGISGPELVAAVSNAGGLGVLAAWGLSMAKLRDAVRMTRDLTDRPFALNIMPVNVAFTRSRTELAIREGIGIVTTGRGDPRAPIVKLLKSEGVKVIGVVPTVRHARRLEAEGVDAIVASGCEAGGHVGKVATMPLVPQVADAVNIPVIAAGGIMDARGFLAALALGACGVQLGTRFVASVEALTSMEEKQRVLEATDEDTVVTEVFTGKPVRVLTSPQLIKLIKDMNGGLSQEETRQRILELRKKKRSGEPGYNSVTSGQGAGMIHEILPAEEIIRGIIAEAQLLYRRLNPAGRR